MHNTAMRVPTCVYRPSHLYTLHVCIHVDSNPTITSVIFYLKPIKTSLLNSTIKKHNTANTKDHDKLAFNYLITVEK